jgi:hypothetical protein
METINAGIKKKIGFLSSNFMKPCRNIHRSVWQLLAAVAIVTKVQNMLDSLQTSQIFAVMVPCFKFVQPIPIVLAYIVPLDVHVVPIKFHQFMFVPHRPKKSESIGQSLAAVAMEIKKGGS